MKKYIYFFKIISLKPNMGLMNRLYKKNTNILQYSSQDTFN